MKINGHTIGEGNPTYVIAELSANHQQSFEKALVLVEAAYKAGADAVKLQTYTPDTITIDSKRKEFRIESGSLWAGKTLYDLYGKAYTPWEWQPKLKEEALKLGMDLFSSPFDPTAVDFLEAMDVPAYKIASFEIVDIPLIRKVAETGKPIVISTGMASKEEISDALEATGNCPVALLKCTSAYPARPEEMHLRTIPAMIEEFDVPVGLSDHTLGIEVPVTAIHLGACIIEKHFTLDRKDGGPDSTFSLEPKEFRAMVDAVHEAEKNRGSIGLDERILGNVQYGPSEREKRSLQFRRSLFAVKDIAKGEALTHENVRSIRPGHGLPPKELPTVLGKKAMTAIERGTPLTWEMIQL